MHSIFHSSQCLLCNIGIVNPNKISLDSLIILFIYICMGLSVCYGTEVRVGIKSPGIVVTGNY